MLNENDHFGSVRCQSTALVTEDVAYWYKESFSGCRHAQIMPWLARESSSYFLATTPWQTMCWGWVDAISSSTFVRRDMPTGPACSSASCWQPNGSSSSMQLAVLSLSALLHPLCRSSQLHLLSCRFETCSSSLGIMQGTHNLFVVADIHFWFDTEICLHKY